MTTVRKKGRLDMAEENDLKVIMPVGWEAGREVGLAAALASLAIEMLAHRSDLVELGARGQLPDPVRDATGRHAADLERYATAIQSLSVQLQPGRFVQGQLFGLVEMASEHHVALPEWMTADDRRPE